MNSGAGQNMTLDGTSFREIAALAYRESGLTLVEEKSSMIQSRLRHRLRDLGLQTFSAYCELINSSEGQSERRHLISALTTNVSHFFRENHHYDILKDEVAKRSSTLRAGGEMRIWSAGCSNGQEALSAAITVLETIPNADELNLRILGTDIDPEVVNFAREGRYPERLIGGVPEPLKKKHFDVETDSSGDAHYITKPKLRKMIQFNELNLLGDWSMRKRFDIIFCRNVVIYFDLKTQNGLWPRYHNALTSDGVLFLGHSERITEPAAFGFTCTGPTTYRRLKD
jgi:chemotaxis protein methyltransferase CheR